MAQVEIGKEQVKKIQLDVHKSAVPGEIHTREYALDFSLTSELQVIIFENL